MSRMTKQQWRLRLHPPRPRAGRDERDEDAVSEQRLSETERDELRRRADDDPWEEFGGETILKLLDDHDDLTARLAKVEALGTAWVGFDDSHHYGDAVLAALSDDPGPEGSAR